MVLLIDLISWRWWSECWVMINFIWSKYLLAAFFLIQATSFLKLIFFIGSRRWWYQEILGHLLTQYDAVCEKIDFRFWYLINNNNNYYHYCWLLLFCICFLRRFKILISKVNESVFFFFYFVSYFQLILLFEIFINFFPFLDLLISNFITLWICEFIQ